MWVVHVLGVCALVALVKCRSVVPTAQGTNAWAGLSRVQGLETKPALPLKKGVATVNVDQEKRTPEAVLPEFIQQFKAYVGSEKDEALGTLEEMFRETEEYEDETSNEEGDLGATEPNNPDRLDGLCVVRTILRV